jgi:hypothetical protein
MFLFNHYLRVVENFYLVKVFYFEDFSLDQDDLLKHQEHSFLKLEYPLKPVFTKQLFLDLLIKIN